MSLIQTFSKLSSRAKAWWILGLIVVFVFIVGLTVGGDYYNSFVKNLAFKTNNIVVLPVIKTIPFSLGLDLQGGAHLVYKADVKNIPEQDRAGALSSARDVIERRVNAFGVSEPLVTVNRGMSGDYQIIAELAGIKDVSQAIKTIGEMPILEFKEQATSTALLQVVSALSTNSTATSTSVSSTTSSMASSTATVDLNKSWKNTELTGKYLQRASVQFNQNDGSPEVSLNFNSEGAKLFEDITARNIGKPVAIFLDGYIISAPTVNDKITGGQASISGNFSIDEAKTLVTRLNSGALPVPVSLISQKTVGASLGSQSIANSLKAGLIGLLLVSLFMIIYYRFPGFLSVLSLLVYGLTVLAIFKSLPFWLSFVIVIIMIGLIFYTFNELKIFNGGLALLFILIGFLLFFYALKPVTLSLSGIAGFILSIGMAVDANILIFSRTREELKSGKSVSQAVNDGFKRAWPSIRDGNVSTLITCLILMFFGTSTVQGFGTTLFIGISVSLFSAIVVTHTLFEVILGDWLEKRAWLLGARPDKKLTE
ncbi:MAG: preprotein translocase subunit SecD [Patescibacteria group bacterium]|jgi:protein-export membrane protein SecD